MKRMLAIPAALVVAAFGAAGCGSSDTTSSASTTTNTTTSTTTETTTTSAQIDGKTLFISGKTETGALACGSCHKLAAAGTTGSIGPDLDKIATADDAAALAEMIKDPNGEIVDGYKKDVMPLTYTKTLTEEEIQAIATYIDKNSKHAE